MGLFTSQYIRSGVQVIRFGGFLHPRRLRFNYERLAKGSIVGLSEDVLLAEAPSSELDHSDFINHCCDPNLGMTDAVTLELRRDVEAGEELTADYAYWEVDTDYIMERECQCAASNCRVRITGRDWQSGVSHLAEYATPFIKRRIQREQGRGENQ